MVFTSDVNETLRHGLELENYQTDCKEDSS